MRTKPSPNPLTVRSILAKPSPDPLTVRRILYRTDEHEQSTKSVRQALQRHGVYDAARRALTALGHASRDALEQEVARLANDMLGAPVADILIAGYRELAGLAAAAQATADEPGLSKSIPLSPTRLASRDVWTIDVSVAPAHISIECVLEVTLDVDAVVVTLTAGRIVQIGDANATIHAILSVLGEPVADQSSRIDVNRHMRLNPGIQLATPGPAATRHVPSRSGSR